VLGLNVLFDFLKFLNYEKRFRFAPKKDTPNPVDAPVTGNSAGSSSAGTSVRAKWLSGAGAFAAGAAFGAGWTPCVGPILSGILMLAAGSRVPIAVLYLAFYSLGLGLPFLLASIFFNAFLKTSRKIRKYLPVIRRVSGALLILIGVLIITGRYQALNIFLSGSSL
jgi:cytochrome c-type biogenesis protein